MKKRQIIFIGDTHFATAHGEAIFDKLIVEGFEFSKITSSKELDPFLKTSPGDIFMLDSITCRETTATEPDTTPKKGKKTGFNPYPMLGNNPNDVFNNNKSFKNHVK